MTMLRGMTVALALFLAQGPAFAQQAPAPAPATAPAAQIAESHLAAARDVVIGSGLSRGFEGMVPQIADQIRAGYSRTRPEIIKDMEEALKPIIAELSKQTDQMVGASARLFALRMSEAELKEVGAFFKTPAGQKYVATQAPLLNDLFSEMQVFSQTLGNVMMDKLRDELKKKNIQL
jgi:uncharacterized protein